MTTFLYETLSWLNVDLLIFLCPSHTSLCFGYISRTASAEPEDAKWALKMIVKSQTFLSVGKGLFNCANHKTYLFYSYHSLPLLHCELIELRLLCCCVWSLVSWKTWKLTVVGSSNRAGFVLWIPVDQDCQYLSQGCVVVLNVWARSNILNWGRHCLHSVCCVNAHILCVVTWHECTHSPLCGAFLRLGISTFVILDCIKPSVAS